MKKNLIQIKRDDNLNIIQNLEAYEYNYTDNDLKKFIGFIAQDVENIDPLAISKHDDILSINYNNLFIHNINATKKIYDIIQNQNEIKQNQNKRIDSLESFISSKLNNNIAISPNQTNPLDEMNKNFDDMNTKLLEQQNTIIEMNKLLVKMKKIIIK